MLKIYLDMFRFKNDPMSSFTNATKDGVLLHLQEGYSLTTALQIGLHGPTY